MSINIQVYKSNLLLSEQLANNIGECLNAAIAEKGRATLILSGGNTPKYLFHNLSEQPLRWDCVNITSCDEKLLDEIENTNDSLLKRELLKNNCAQARYYSLQGNTEPLKNVSLDVAVLGLGIGAHTASLFPDAENKEELFYGQEFLYPVKSLLAECDRISIGLQRLLSAKVIFLHIIGKSKLDLLLSAVEDTNSETPISFFLTHPNIKIMWACHD